MKYFFKTLILIPLGGVLLFSILFCFLLYVVPVNINSYSLAHIDKIKMLEIDKKKMVLFGGSNVAFGFDSYLLEKEFPQYKVINVGTHASLGMRYPLKEIKDKLVKGDVLIISPEYAQFRGGYGGVPLLEICLYKKSLKHIELQEFLTGIKNIKEFAQIYANSKMSNKMYGKIFTYDRRGFNKKGDYVEHHKFNRVNNLSIQSLKIEKIDKSIVQFFSNVTNELKEKGVDVLFVPPAFQRSSGLASFETINRIDRFLRDNNIVFISKPEEYFIDDKYFYDTVNHLNEEGAKIRTEKLIIDLKGYIRD